MSTKIKKQKTGGFIPAVKTIAKSIREYKKPSILAPLFVALEVVLECLIPYVMTILLGAMDYINGTATEPNPLSVSVVNLISGGGEPVLLTVILWFGLTLVLLALLSLCCGALSGRFCAVASSGFAKNLRKDMYYNVQNFSFSNIDKFSSSSLITRLTTDVMHVEMSYMMIIRTAVRSPFMLIFSMVMAFTLNARMALIFLCTTPILAVGLILIMRKAIPFFTRIFKKYDKMNESVEENISGMRVVKSYVREDYEKEKFDKASSNVKNDFIKAEKIIAFNGPLMNFCVYGGLIAMYMVGSFLIIDSKETLLKMTELQSFMTYSFQMLMSLMMLSMIMVQLIMSTASIKRIAEVINEKPSIVSPENALTEVEDGSIEFINTSFKYGTAPTKDENSETDTHENEHRKFALSNINLKIESGQTVGIIGSTGSSKTTLVQLIPRLYDATEGQVLVGGKDVKTYDLEVLRNSVAMVLQKNVLFSGTVRENMQWGDKTATDQEIMHALNLAQIGNFDLDKKIEQGGANVSGGQKQRLCIARAMLKKPKILILDDSTSAVDTKTDALIRKSFKEYIPQTTKIIIAQRIASVQDADLIVIMDNGIISDMGTHEQLLERNTIYQELYDSQTKANSEKEEN